MGGGASRLIFAGWCFEYPERELHDWLLIFVMVMNFLVCVALTRVQGHEERFFWVVVVYIRFVLKGDGCAQVEWMSRKGNSNERLISEFEGSLLAMA